MCHNTEEFGVKSPKDVGPFGPEPDVFETTDMEPLSDDDLPAGRIVHDERGNALWKWRGDTSSTDTTDASGVLKYIDPLDLAVEGQKSSEVPDTGGGYDPYNQGGAWNKARRAKG